MDVTRRIWVPAQWMSQRQRKLGRLQLATGSPAVLLSHRNKHDITPSSSSGYVCHAPCRFRAELLGFRLHPDLAFSSRPPPFPSSVEKAGPRIVTRFGVARARPGCWGGPHRNLGLKAWHPCPAHLAAFPITEAFLESLGRRSTSLRRQPLATFFIGSCSMHLHLLAAVCTLHRILALRQLHPRRRRFNGKVFSLSTRSTTLHRYRCLACRTHLSSANSTLQYFRITPFRARLTVRRKATALASYGAGHTAADKLGGRSPDE